MFEDLVPWLNDKGMVIITEPSVHVEYAKFKYLRTWYAYRNYFILLLAFAYFSTFAYSRNIIWCTSAPDM